jgi:hypothetical protein
VVDLRAVHRPLEDLRIAVRMELPNNTAGLRIDGREREKERERPPPVE